MRLIRLTDEQASLLVDEIRFQIGVYQELQEEDGGYEDDVEFWITLEKAIHAGETFIDEDRCPGCNCGPGDGITADCNHPAGCGHWKRLSENG